MSGPESAAQRVVSIDVLRGFALMGMVMCHFMIYYGTPEAMGTWLYFVLNHMLGDMGAAWFLMLTGMSQVLSAGKSQLQERALLKKALIRGTYIFLVGLLMLALAWGPKEIWQWDILTLMGAATIVLFFCRRLPSWLILLGSLAVILLTPWLRTGIDFTPLWGGKFVPVPVVSDYLPGILYDPAGDYKVAWNFIDIFNGFFIAGYFPIFPWLAYPMLGLVVGRRIAEKRINQDLPFYLIIGAILFVAGLAVAYASLFRPGSSPIYDYIAPLSFYPDSMTMICVQTGIALIVFSLVYANYDVRTRRPDRSRTWLTLCRRMSRSSLTVYFFHYLLITWPLWAIYFATGRYLIEGALGSIPALGLGLIGVVVFQFVLIVWDRHSNRFSLEWFMAAITDRLIRRDPLPGRTDHNRLDAA